MLCDPSPFRQLGSLVPISQSSDHATGPRGTFTSGTTGDVGIAGPPRLVEDVPLVNKTEFLNLGTKNSAARLEEPLYNLALYAEHPGSRGRESTDCVPSRQEQYQLDDSYAGPSDGNYAIYRNQPCTDCGLNDSHEFLSIDDGHTESSANIVYSQCPDPYTEASSVYSGTSLSRGNPHIPSLPPGYDYSQAILRPACMDFSHLPLGGIDPNDNADTNLAFLHPHIIRNMSKVEPKKVIQYSKLVRANLEGMFTCRTHEDFGPYLASLTQTERGTLRIDQLGKGGK